MKRRDITTVDLEMPHSHITQKKGSKCDHVLSEEMLDWFADRGLYTNEPTDIYTKPEENYRFGSEMRYRCHRGYGSVGGWIKEVTYCRFFFVDPQDAMMFKLSWAGL